jgi:hypothetical protein
MVNWLFVYYGGMMATTPEEQKKSMDAWKGWFGKLGKAIVDGGAPTKPCTIVSKSGTSAIGANPVTGYTIIQADTLDAAVVMANGCPSIPEDGQVAIYELLPMQ